NLTHCKPNEIEAIRLALKHKDDLSALIEAQSGIQLQEGLSIGAVYTVHALAKRLGIEKALGANHEGKLALWQVLARVLDQGSRLSAVRLAGFHAAGDVLGFKRGFDENDLYANLGWLCDNQVRIEDSLFSIRRGEVKPELFLYDVTSSYLEGDKNALAEFGYNRDKKRGKKQIVIGLLCDEAGDPVSAEVFEGNTSDLSTFESQVKKAAERFGCRRVTFVGNRGLIKSGQIEDLSAAGFHYITAITKAQIRSLIIKDVFQLGLFDEQLCEVEYGGVRYILRRNPVRADEMAAGRASKLSALQSLAEKQNAYLAAHPKADPDRAFDLVVEKRNHLGLWDWVRIKDDDRRIILEVEEDTLREISELDGCYALQTDLPAAVASKELVHDRYKDLGMVEQDFRTMKTGLLKVRPLFVRTEANTRGHVLVVMLACLIVRELRRCWAGMDLTVEEGLHRLSTLSVMTMIMPLDGAEVQQIPRPREESARLLAAAGVKLPVALPARGIRVVTRKKLPPQRKSI
ncbi:MAG: IS1634 family transposase, partial [Pseudomonadota bacterium]